MKEGWKCPQCGKVWAPHVDECRAFTCSGFGSISTSPAIQPYTPLQPNPNTSPPWAITCSGGGGGTMEY